MEKIKFVSVVVPSFRQEKTIEKDMENLNRTLSQLPYKYEIIVVVDGNVDNTHEKVKALENKNIHVTGYEKNFGKGYAVRYGMLKAKGDVIGFIDAGMDIDPAGISMLLNHMSWYDADIVVGSKLHPVSKVSYPITRKVLSWGYRTLTRILFGFRVRDTQVGLKFFRREVVEDVFPRLLVKKFAFDIEILAVSYALGYKKIYEAPVKLIFQNASTITSRNLWNTIFHMIWDTFAVFYRLKIIHYYRKSNKAHWISYS